MKLPDLTPYTRFASRIIYSARNQEVYGIDCRIIYAISGDFEISVGENTYHAVPGSVFFCSSGIRYRISSSKDISLYALNFDLSWEFCEFEDINRPVLLLDDHRHELFKTHIDDIEFLNGHLFLKNGISLMKDIEQIIDEFELKKKYYREVCSGCLKKLIVRIARFESENTNAYNQATKIAMQYINDNYKNSISNKDVAKITGYHEYYLNRLFLGDTGSTIHQYIIEKRISYAKKILLNTNYTISEASKMTGFNSESHFSSYFKQYTGYTPIKFRSSFRNII